MNEFVYMYIYIYMYNTPKYFDPQSISKILTTGCKWVHIYVWYKQLDDIIRFNRFSYPTCSTTRVNSTVRFILWALQQRSDPRRIRIVELIKGEFNWIELNWIVELSWLELNWIAQNTANNNIYIYIVWIYYVYYINIYMYI